ncbi:hypothetical protein BHE74_00017707 [Ensete ventricosum]|nr:hypothetical protein BHE74_00017707 [Ensete ventricosum]RZR76589.1 hypothetical protein BHM03_00001434 [Ensete ventricosum]
MLLVLVTSQTTSRIMPLIQVLQRMVMDPEHLKITYMLKSVMMITMGMEMMILGITRILIFYFDTTCSDFFFLKYSMDSIPFFFDIILSDAFPEDLQHLH